MLNIRSPEGRIGGCESTSNIKFVFHLIIYTYVHICIVFTYIYTFQSWVLIMPLCQGRGKTDCAECAHCVHQRFEAGSSYCYYGSHFNRQINQCFRKLNIGEGSAYRRYPVSQHRAF